MGDTPVLAVINSRNSRVAVLFLLFYQVVEIPRPSSTSNTAGQRRFGNVVFANMFRREAFLSQRGRRQLQLEPLVRPSSAGKGQASGSWKSAALCSLRLPSEPQVTIRMRQTESLDHCCNTLDTS